MEFTKASRDRSPNYPRYSLKDCYGFLKKLYEKNKFKEMHVDEAISIMGHSKTSSTAPRVLASMTSFGLIESRGTKDNKFIQISRLGRELCLEEFGSTKWYMLLRQAALIDNSMKGIWEKWGTELPSDETIRKELLLNMGFSDEGSKYFSSVVSETYSFADLRNGTPIMEDPEDNISDAPIPNTPLSKELVDNTNTASVRKANLLLKGIGREVIITVPANFTTEEYEIMLQWLAVQKNGFVVHE